jgi:hypothetical protein
MDIVRHSTQIRDIYKRGLIDFHVNTVNYMLHMHVQLNLSGIVFPSYVR